MDTNSCEKPQFTTVTSATDGAGGVPVPKTWSHLLILCLLLCTSCVTKRQVLYFQSDERVPVEVIAPTAPFTLHAGDLIGISVSSKDPLMSQAFNATSSGESPTYMIDSKGYIKFPILGNIQAEGKNREELARYIEQTLITRDLLKDPIVMVSYVNFEYSILGEIGHPGSFPIEKDRITLVDAISRGGDLTIYGNRKKIKVMRQEDDGMHTYRVNLLSAKQLYQSPVYYLQPGDVVYVEPNRTKAGQSSINGNSMRTPAFWTSLASVVLLVIKIF